MWMAKGCLRRLAEVGSERRSHCTNTIFTSHEYHPERICNIRHLSGCGDQAEDGVSSGID